MYLTFSEWLDIGGENIGVPAYTQLEFSARRKIDRYTFDRLVNKSEIPQDVKMTMFQIIKILQAEQSGQRVQTVINDGIHVTFAEQKSTDEEISQIVNEYLSADLTYMGG